METYLVVRLFLFFITLVAAQAFAQSSTPTPTQKENLTLCIKAWDAFQHGQSEEAASLYDQCIQSGHLSADSLVRAYRAYGSIYYRKREINKIIEWANKAIALQAKDSWQDYMRRGDALSELGKYKEALQDYDTAEKLNPEAADIFYNRGIVFEMMHEYGRAKEEFVAASEKGPVSLPLYERLLVYKVINPFSYNFEVGTTSPIAASALPLADAINTVWEVLEPACKGPDLRARHFFRPAGEAIRQSKLIQLPSLGVKISVPQLPGIKETDVELNLGDHTRGVIDNYIAFSEAGSAAPAGVIVFTDLPPNVDSVEKALGLEVLSLLPHKAETGTSATLQKISGPYGGALELIVKNRLSSTCFPTSTFLHQPYFAQERTMGISRFVFVQKKLVEFALIVPIPEEMQEEQALAYARKVMDGFWLSLSPL